MENNIANSYMFLLFRCVIQFLHYLIRNYLRRVLICHLIAHAEIYIAYFTYPY